MGGTPKPRNYGMIRKVPVFSPAETRAVTVTNFRDVTVVVVIGKVTLVAPAGTVTKAGTFELAELSKIAMSLPPGPATPLMTTRHDVDCPPVTSMGVKESAVGISGASVRGCVCVTAPSLAEIVVFTVLVIAVTVI